jgi:hypothetical protein
MEYTAKFRGMEWPLGFSQMLSHHCRTHLMWNIRGKEWGWLVFWLVSQLYSIQGIHLYYTAVRKQGTHSSTPWYGSPLSTSMRDSESESESQGSKKGIC